MISRLRGPLLEKGDDTVVVDAGGVGYEVRVAASSLARLPAAGENVELFISESVAMYGGGMTLYGFSTADERELFLTLRDHVPSTGAKKALEYLDKASRSLPDFRRALLDSDARMLVDVFGFTRKTAERLIAGLKDKLGDGAIRADGRPPAATTENKAMAQALDALATLGYKPGEARAALQSVAADLQGRAAAVEDILRLALKRL